MSYNGLVEEFRKIDVWHDCCNNSDEAQMKPTCQPESTAMNSQFNYATFVELFLKTDDEHAPSALSQCPAADLTEKIAEPGLDNPISPPA